MTHPELVDLLQTFISSHKAGSPTDSSIYWIHLKPKEIARLFNETYTCHISNYFVKRQLKAMGFKYRKLRKTLATGHFSDRDLQFKIIFQLIGMMSLNYPVISIDCKKKENLGTLYREGKCYSTDSVAVFDHDYPSLKTGKVIPHGIYDMQRNEGYMTIGNSSETAAFITDNLEWWWENFGIHYYPDAKSIIILCDAGGGNNYRHHIFKLELLKLAKKIGRDIVVAHYPPYASKWNPIEHRLFCHVHRAMQGVVFTDYNIVKELMEKTRTETGLKVTVRFNLKKYKTGIKVEKEDVEYHRIQFNKNMPILSYRISA